MAAVNLLCLCRTPTSRRVPLPRMLPCMSVGCAGISIRSQAEDERIAASSLSIARAVERAVSAPARVARAAACAAADLAGRRVSRVIADAAAAELLLHR